MDNIKLHLGCAKRRLAGFVNVDREPSKEVDVVADVSDLSAFETGSVSEIYSSHTLEYFDREQVRLVLAEWRRVLKVGGRVSVTVPDLANLIRIYEKSGEIRTILGPLFGKWHNENNGEIIYHRTVWDFASLKDCLANCGFGSVERFDPVSYLGKIDPTFDDYSLAYYPHMDRQGIPVSLAMTAVKLAED